LLSSACLSFVRLRSEDDSGGHGRALVAHQRGGGLGLVAGRRPEDGLGTPAAGSRWGGGRRRGPASRGPRVHPAGGESSRSFSALLLLREVRLPEAESRWAGPRRLHERGALDPDSPRRRADSPAPRLPRLPQASLSWLERTPLTLYEPCRSCCSTLLRARGGGHLWLVLALVPAGFLGKILGTTLLKRTSERAFRVISLGVVLLTGALGVAAAL
jgi:hypothetical protein